MKTYLFGDLEVIPTGRYVDKHNHRIIEVKSVDEKLNWTMFVDINSLFEIKHIEKSHINELNNEFLSN